MPLFPNPPYASPLSSDVVLNGGDAIPRRSLDRCAIPVAGLAHVCILGDSVPQGTAVQPGANVTNANGYFDGLCNRLQRAIELAFGGIKGAGFYGLWRSANEKSYNNSAHEWSFAGTWNQIGATLAQSKIPYQGAFSCSAAAANIATFTPPAAVAARYVKDATTFALTFTVAAGSNGVSTNTFAGAGVLNVNESTAAAPATGTIVVIGALGIWSVITYTGKGANSFTGCTLVDNSPNLVLATNQTVDMTRVVNSATAAFAGGTDRGQTVYGANIPRNAHVVSVADATHAVISLPATAGGTNGAFGLTGRNQVPGGIAAFEIVYVDNSATGGVAGSYSLDGGATWTNIPSTTPASPQLKRLLVNSAITTTLKIRGADNGGVGHAMTLAGVILYSVTNPTSTPGVVVHNICRDGATLNSVTAGGTNLGILPPAGSGDYLALLDNGGDSTQQSLQPSLVVLMVSNDYDLVELGTITVAQHQANLQTLINRFAGYADLLVINVMEQSRTASSATQATVRAATAATCAANGIALIDVYQAWGAQGEVGFTVSFNDGLMVDGLHPSLEGHADIAARIARCLGMMGI